MKYSKRTSNAVLTALLVAVGILPGCARVEPQQDYARVHELIKESTGHSDAYDPQRDVLSAEEIGEFLADGLTLDEAVRLALMNSRRLQGAFCDIGIARADWVQAGLLSNPTLGISILFPEGGGRSSLQANMAQNIVDLWQIPVRKEIAEHRVECQILRVARLSGELASEVKRAYYLGVAAQEQLSISESFLSLLKKSHEVIGTQLETGLASSLDEGLQRAQVLEAELALREANLAVRSSKRALARLLSLDCSENEIVLVDAIPDAAVAEFDANTLIALAREKRLDLRALAESTLADRTAIDLEYMGVFPEVSLGAGAERLESRSTPGRNVVADATRASLRNGALTVPDIESRGERQMAKNAEIDFMAGPTLALELPLFDQNQAQIAKARYSGTKAVKSYDDLYLNVAQDIRIAVDRTSTLWSSAAFYKDELLPQVERNQDFTAAAYQAGTVDILTLLASQRSLLDARRGYVEVWSAAAISLTDLERAVGLSLQEVQVHSSNRETELESVDDRGQS